MGTLISILKRFINSDLTKPINTMIDEVKAMLTLIKAKTDTITADLFTATHASRIDANISSRQADAGLTTTHSSRIDASISSRATNDGVWSANGRVLSFVIASNTVRLSDSTEYNTQPPMVYRFLMKLSGNIRISFDLRNVSSSSTTHTISVKSLGIQISSFSVTSGTTYNTVTIDSLPISVGAVEVTISNGSSVPIYIKNFKVMYDYDNLDTPRFL